MDSQRQHLATGDMEQQSDMDTNETFVTIHSTIDFIQENGQQNINKGEEQQSDKETSGLSDTNQSNTISEHDSGRESITEREDTTGAVGNVSVENNLFEISAPRAVHFMEEDVDVADGWKPYADDVVNYLFEAEKKYRVEAGFLHGREDVALNSELWNTLLALTAAAKICAGVWLFEKSRRGSERSLQQVTPRMRFILVDWLIEVHSRLDLTAETLYRAFNVLDRYLSLGQADKTNLQLLGVSCMTLAAKYAEVCPVKLGEFSYFADDAFTSKDILSMECKVLTTINYDLGGPTVVDFIRLFKKCYETKVVLMMNYLSENAVSSYATCHLNPSVIAAVSAWIAVHLEGSPFTPAHYRIARVSREVVHNLVPQFARDLINTRKDGKRKALRSKYESVEHLKIACFTELQMAILQNFVDPTYVDMLT